MTMQWNDRDVAQGFMGQASQGNQGFRPQRMQTTMPRSQTPGDANNNGIPDREELSIKVSRPARNGMALSRPNNMPVTTPVQPQPNGPQRALPTNVQAYFPAGLDVNNFRQFMQTPAGQEHMRSIIDKVRGSMTPAGQKPRGIFDRLMRQFGGQ